MSGSEYLINGQPQWSELDSVLILPVRAMMILKPFTVSLWREQYFNVPFNARPVAAKRIRLVLFHDSWVLLCRCKIAVVASLVSSLRLLFRSEKTLMGDVKSLHSPLSKWQIAIKLLVLSASARAVWMSITSWFCSDRNFIASLKLLTLGMAKLKTMPRMAKATVNSIIVKPQQPLRRGGVYNMPTSLLTCLRSIRWAVVIA